MWDAVTKGLWVSLKASGCRLSTFLDTHPFYKLSLDEADVKAVQDDAKNKYVNSRPSVARLMSGSQSGNIMFESAYELISTSSYSQSVDAIIAPLLAPGLVVEDRVWV